MGLGANRPGSGASRGAHGPGRSADDDDIEDLDVPDILAVLAREVAQVPPLRAGEEEALLKRLKAGDSRAGERLLEISLQIVLTSATARADRGLPVGDLFQEGSMGLLAAIGSFRGEGPAEFRSFLVSRVDSHLDAALEAEAAAVKAELALVEAAADFDRVELLLARELRRRPTDAEIGARLEWDPTRTAEVRAVVDEARRRHDEEILAFVERDEFDSLEPIEIEERSGRPRNHDGELN